jgi:arylsulfatase A-like enzyme
MWVYAPRKRGVGFVLVLILCFFPGNLTVAVDPPKESRRVVLVVWDGMRPDFVTPEYTPTLWKLAQEGVTFRNHHAVYLSATHVNGVAIETGMYPQHNGLIANYDYRPEIDSQKFVSTEQPSVIEKGDKISHGKYLQVPTLAELVRRSGGRTAVAAAKTVGFLLDRQPDARASGNSVTLSAGEALPPTALGPIGLVAGPYPGSPMYSHAQRDSWTTTALTQSLWKEGVPAFSILWLGEPDLSQHETAPGAPSALAAIKSSDQNLAMVLSALEQKGVRSNTDVLVVSDHGFSTIEHAIDVRKYLKEDGLNAVVDFKNPPKRGDIMLVGNGGSVLFYVIGHDATVLKQLVARLQQSNFAGVILTKQEMPGTFPLAKLQIDTPGGPDVVMAFRWTNANNEFGVPGLIDGDWNRQGGKGTHATLSRFDMHNILFAAGPDFGRGAVDDLPTGNVDLAPTILSILKIDSLQKMDGRILSEVMLTSDNKEQKPITETFETMQDFPAGTWRQTLQQSRVGSTIYLDEGNGAFTAKLEK